MTSDMWPIFCALAEKCFFLRSVTLQDLVNNDKICISDVQQMPFAIRKANLDDLDNLLELEENCWDKCMRINAQQIHLRLTSDSHTTWVATVDNRVMGVIYTQRINSVDDIISRMKFSTYHTFGTPTGEFLQLIAVAVNPSVKNMQIGKALRDFMLLQAFMTDTISDVVAVTRCSAYLSSGTPFAEHALSLRDPTIRFHCDGGATVVAVLPDFRPEDMLNEGNGVLIRYSLSRSSQNATGVTHRLLASAKSIDAEALSQLVYETLGSPDGASHISMDSFLSQPFMALGLDSLQMQQLASLISERTGAGPLSSTFLFDYPTPRAVLSYFKQHRISSFPTTVPATSTHLPPTCEYAIVGMSCRFPGGGNSPEEFYNMLQHAVDAVVEIPDTWGWDGFSGRAGVIDDFFAESFDARYFGLSPAEVDGMDPHQRLLLEVGYEALRCSHHFINSADGKDVGVYVGMCNPLWAGMEMRAHVDASICTTSECAIGPYASTGTSTAAAANRLSFLLNLTGPSMVVDTACSSSLVAVHMACSALAGGECNTALVMSADLLLAPYALEIRQGSQMLSPDGKCKVFDSAANGYVRGEGAGAVVLRRLADAEADYAAGVGPPILAVIKATAANQDGKSASFTAPNGQCQQALLQEALSRGRVAPDEVSYIETHGTGTALGDPIEFSAIRDVFLNNCAIGDASALILGAVKSNIGHLEGAAGLAGLIKAVMSLRHSSVPPNIHFKKVNPAIDLSTQRAVEFPVMSTPLITRTGRPPIAGVSSFGSGGTNSHVLLQQHSSSVIANSDNSDSCSEDGSSSEVVFVFTGQGVPDLLSTGLGMELFDSEEVFRNTFTLCSQCFSDIRQLLGCDDSVSLVDILSANLSIETQSQIQRNEALYTQCMLYSLEVSLCRLWESSGVFPTVVIGHSLGEYAAAVCAGALDIKTALQLVAIRAWCVEHTPSSTGERGTMYAVRASQTMVEEAIESIAWPNSELRPAVAAVNGHLSCVIAGVDENVLRVISLLGCSSKKLLLTHSFHSPLLSNAAIAFIRTVKNLNAAGAVIIESKTPHCRMISTVTGLDVEKSDLTVEYWSRHITNTVQFCDAFMGLLKSFRNEGYAIVEVGPGKTLHKFTMAIAAASNLPSGKFGWFSSILPERKRDSDVLYLREQVTSALQWLRRWSLSTVVSCRVDTNYSPALYKWRHKGSLFSVSRKNRPGQGSAVSTSNIALSASLLETVRCAISSVLPSSIDFDDQDSLVSLGIDSLGAVQVRNELSKEFGGIDLPSALVFEYPTVASVASCIQQLQLGSQKGRRKSRANSLLLEVQQHNRKVTFDMPKEYEAMFPATRMQQAMLFHYMSDPSSGTFLETFSWYITSDGRMNRVKFDVAAFRNAWVDTIIDHASLRSSFDMEASPPMQLVWKPHVIGLNKSQYEAQYSWFEFSSTVSNSKDGTVKSKIQEHRRSGCVHPGDPLSFKVSLVKLSQSQPVEYALIFSVHHAIVDGWSIRNLLHCLRDNYTRHASVQGHYLDEQCQLFPSFEAYAMYENSLLEFPEAHDLDLLKAFWSNSLRGWKIPNVFNNMPPLMINTSDEEVMRCAKYLSSDLLIVCRKAASLVGVTLASFFHASWSVVYKSMVTLDSDTPGVLYGCTATGRSAPVQDLGEIIGPVINTFPVRLTWDNDENVKSFLARVHKHLLDCIKHENLPLTEIQRLTSTPVKGSLFPVIFDYQHEQLFNCEFVGDLYIKNDSLIDRIGCPLSVRTVVGSESAQLIATSECLEYNSSFLEGLLCSVEMSLQALASCIDSDDGLKTTMQDFERKVSRKLHTTPHYPRLPNPILPERQVATGVKHCTRVELVKAIAGTQFTRALSNCSYYKLESLNSCMLSAFLVAVKRHSSSSLFSIDFLDKASSSQHITFSLHSKLSWYEMTLLDVLKQSELEEQLAMNRINISSVKKSSEMCNVAFCEWSSNNEGNYLAGGAKRKMTLFCFHTAGGSSAQFTGWKDVLTNMAQCNDATSVWNVELVSVDLPGHGTKLSEPVMKDLSSIVNHLLISLREMLWTESGHPNHFCFLGYSMGALVAYELALAVTKAYGTGPDHIFVLAEAAPMHIKSDADSLADTGSLMKDLTNQGWYSKDFLDLSTSDAEFFLTTARADLLVESTYVWDPDSAQQLHCPVTVFYGCDDTTLVGRSDIGEEAVWHWKKVSAGAFNVHAVPGGHMIMDSESNKKFVLDEVYCSINSIDIHPDEIFANYLVCNVIHASQDKFTCKLSFSDKLDTTVIESIHKTYSAMLDLVCSDDPQVWKNPVSEAIAPPPSPVPVSPPCPLSKDLMHEGFIRVCKTATNCDIMPAVVSYDELGERDVVMYSDMQRYATIVASELLNKVPSLIESSVVAVLMDKGWEQVVAVLGVHMAQCVYLPMDSRSWPEHRVTQVLDLSKCAAVLTQSRVLSSCQWLNEISIPVMDVNSVITRHGKHHTPDVDSVLCRRKRVDPTDLAYLIYTSGSTGVPKGVCCHHQGAVNTIADLNERFSVTSSDRVFGLSSLSFDLSVYDIFGLLSAGGTVVLPSSNCIHPPDPEEWIGILTAEMITIWDTVPAFMELMVTHCEYSNTQLPASLRLVYMSGDWIPLSLPNRIRAVSACPDIRIISMGGATEAAIWSNMFELSKEGSGIPPGWSSIPYGRPLRNQTMYVLNEELDNCESWVTGGIYIGGAGVAKGYYNNPERTRYQFIVHPRTGESLFRTGDLGRVRPCGNIEILGREDSQVKVNGFRIELGEIERVLMKDKRVSSAALTVHHNALCAYLVLSDMNGSVDIEGSSDYSDASHDEVFQNLRELCQDTLTDYMIPRHFVVLDEIPLSANGKVERSRLPLPDAVSSAFLSSSILDSKKVDPSSRLEAAIVESFAAVLQMEESQICCQSDSFFALGGNSVSAIQLLFRIRSDSGESISVQELFAAPTVCGIAATISARSAKTSQNGAQVIESDGYEIICLQAGSSDEVPLLLFNPAGATGLCYSDLSEHLDGKYPVYCLDDGAILKNVERNESSIDAVAEKCLPLVVKFASAYGCVLSGRNSPDSAVKKVVLGGWSYGGVVATVVAEKLSSTPTLTRYNVDDACSLEIAGIVLFDAPLRNGSSNLNDMQSADENATADDVRSWINQFHGQSEELSTEKTVASHFSYCTSLLRRFYERQKRERPLLSCPVLDIRASQSTYNCSVEDVEEVSSGVISTHKTAGSHFTMLFGKNTAGVAKLVKNSIDSWRNVL